MVKLISKINVLNLSKEELIAQFEDLGLQTFRSTQVWEWLYKKGVRSWEAMTNLSKDHRKMLSETFLLSSLFTDKMQVSQDGTIKFRFKLVDGHLIESVLIPVPSEDRYTVCVSSQVGCSLTCSFCATGQMERKRNLFPSEIYDQVLEVNKASIDHYGSPVTNVVFMGMGEPLLAYKSVVQSIELILMNESFRLSAKRITISTAGIAKMIKKLAEERLKVGLALSLHAPDDEKRNEIMPINEHNNLSVLMDALYEYWEKKKSIITYEYILFDGFNDGEEDAHKLAALCKRFPVKVNIIEYNPVEGVIFRKSSDQRLNRFIQVLINQGVSVMVRRSRGKDIDAACGQLANKE